MAYMLNPQRGETSVLCATAEANHRIANSLTLLMSMVRVQGRAVTRRGKPLVSGDVHFLLEGIAARINTLGHLHRLLSQVPEDGATNLRPHLRAVSDALVEAFSTSPQAVQVRHTGSDCVVLVRHVQPLTLILCEVFINALKYAHPAGAPLIMNIDCAVTAGGRLVLTIADDGVGLPEGVDLHKSGGMGIRVISSLAAEMGASVQIESSSLGLGFRISLPESAMAGARLS